MIDNGLLESRYGLVLLSPAFFRKQWTQRELDVLTEKEMRNGKKVILPVWHNVSHDDVFQFSPPLADKLAGSTADLTKLVQDIKKVLGGPSSSSETKTTLASASQDPVQGAKEKIILESFRTQSPIIRLDARNMDDPQAVIVRVGNQRFDEDLLQRKLFLHALDCLLDEGLVKHASGMLYELTYKGMLAAQKLAEPAQ